MTFLKSFSLWIVGTLITASLAGSGVYVVTWWTIDKVFFLAFPLHLIFFGLQSFFFSMVVVHYLIDEVKSIPLYLLICLILGSCVPLFPTLPIKTTLTVGPLVGLCSGLLLRGLHLRLLKDTAANSSQNIGQ